MKLTALRRFFQQEDLNFLLTNRVPRIALTRLMGRFSRIESRWLTRLSVAVWRIFTELDLSEAKERRFDSLHAVFTRALKPGARRVDPDPAVLASPCDAIVGACGRVEGTQVFQAKGFPYRLEDLFGATRDITPFRDGSFVTLRLTSAMYHRFHAPHDARLEHVTHIAGDTWNVNPIALQRVERLFCRNERAVLRMRLARGGVPVAIVPVAAILVASLRLHALDLRLHLKYRGPDELPCDVPVAKGQELGWFEHGSTILVFVPKGFALADGIAPGTPIRMGQALMRLPADTADAAVTRASPADATVGGRTANVPNSNEENRPMRARRTLLVSALALACASAAFANDEARHRPPQHPPGPPPVRVKVIAFNDFHGTLQSPGTFGINTTIPAAQRPAVGGAEYLAAYVAKMKAQSRHSVVVGAGDFIGASPLVSALFFDEPAVETLNRIGVDFNAVGNHEFDKGSAELKRLQHGGCKLTDGLPDPNSCKGLGSGAPGTFDGAKFKWLSANVVETATGRTLFPPFGIKQFENVKVAFIGMTLKDTPKIVTPTGVAGLEFRDEADTVNALVPHLRRHGVDAIVVLVHQGGFQTSPNVGDINGCDGDLKNTNGTDSDIGAIVRRLDDAVDLVISGHTHAAYNCSANTVDVRSANGVVTSTARPTGLPNKAGRLVPVTSASAFGRVLTDIDLTIDRRSRNVVAVSATNRLVDRTDADATTAVQLDPTVRDIVDGYAALVSPLANRVIGTIAAALPNSANAAGEMPAGSLIADAQLQATQPAALGGAVAAFMNPGGVRNPGFTFATSYPADVTYGNAFTVQPFGNSLVTMTLTAQQLRDVLEQQFVGCKGQTAQRILQVSNGIRYAWSAGAAACAKIVDLTLTPTDVTVTPPVVTGAPETIVANGVVLNPTKTYRVTVNNFLATGGDGFTVLQGGTSPLGGAQDIDALVAYLSSGYKAPKAPYNPADAALSLPRITRLP